MDRQHEIQPSNPLFGALIADLKRNRVKRRLKAAFQRNLKPARVRQPRDSQGE
jgi:RNase P protein component